MHEQQDIQPTPMQPEPAVSFPDPRPTRQSSGGFPKWIFAVIGLVIILAAGGFFLYQSSTSTTENPTPSPFVSGLDTLPTPSETPVATPARSASPAPSATPSSTQRTGVSIEVQNGTGTTGDAAVAKSLIEKAGYTKVTTSNATSQNATSTTLEYSSDVPMSVVTEVAQSLSASFGTVSPTSGLTGKMSIRVITGPKSKTTASATPKASATPAPSGSPRASATPMTSATPKASTTP